jgi:hypothetical protein
MTQPVSSVYQTTFQKLTEPLVLAVCERTAERAGVTSIDTRARGVCARH